MYLLQCFDTPFYFDKRKKIPVSFLAMHLEHNFVFTLRFNCFIYVNDDLKAPYMNCIGICFASHQEFNILFFLSQINYFSEIRCIMSIFHCYQKRCIPLYQNIKRAKYFSGFQRKNIYRYNVKLNQRINYIQYLCASASTSAYECWNRLQKSIISTTSGCR